MAQSSSSTSANSDHDVFINHRGPDTKKTFASYLYRCLRTHQLRVFLDDPELRRGDDLSVQIINAIGSASVHVAIFSPGYADSRWCLDELVQMLDTKKPIITVFYHVKHEELLCTRGKKRTYAEAQDDLASKTDCDGKRRTYAEMLDALARKTNSDGSLRHGPSKIQKWRDALRQVADKSGFDLEACNGDEGELLEKVVLEVLERVKKLALDRHVPKDAKGLDEKVRDFESFLFQRQQSEKPRIFGIVGLGGIGKTTLADKFCNMKKSDYSRSCYLSAVKYQKVNDLISSQKKLLGMLNVTDEEMKRVTDVAEGKAMIRKHLSSYKALVVIDDVDQVDQVDAFLPDPNGINPDSLILITSRNRDVLRNSNVEEESIYTLSGLSKDLGRELAKGSGLPGRLWRWTEEDNGDLLRKSRNGQMTDVRGVRIPLWRDYPQVDDGIRMSSLQYLDAQGDLTERILTKVSSPNLKWLRWMCCHSRFLPSWVPLKNLRVLQIEVGILTTLWKEELEPPLQLRELQIDGCNLLHIPKSIGQLKHLERIVISLVCVEEQTTITELPEEFCGLRSLKVLVLERWSRMFALPKKFGNLTELQHLQLSTCEALKSLPESFGELTNLQHIQLSSCTALDSLPESFGKLSNLQHIQLSSCTALDSLPESFGKLSNLQHINLSHCSALERLPGSFGKLIKLQHLDLMGCRKLSLQRETLGNISTLKYIDLSDCGKIEVLPSQVAHQRSLEQLRLRGTNLKELPSAIGQLSCMEVLELGEDPLLDKLPFQVYDLKKLKELSIYGWEELKVLPDALCDLKNLKKLIIFGCKKLKCLPPSLGDLSNLNKLEIFGCHELNRLPTSIGRLTQLTYLRVSVCPLIRELPLKEEVVRGKRGTLNDFQILPRLQVLHVSETGISEVSFAERVCCNLRRLSIERCNNVVEVGKLPNTLTRLTFSGCVKLKNIMGLGQLKELQDLDIGGCSDLEEVEGIQHCICLSELYAVDCVKLKNIRGLGQLKNLQLLDIEGCSDLEEVEGIQYCTELFRIEARGCPKLQLDAGVKEQLCQQRMRYLSDTVN